MLTQEYVRSILHYDPETGIFVWKADRGCNRIAGKIAGRVGANGYVVFSILNKARYAHRIAWLYMTGAELYT